MRVHSAALFLLVALACPTYGFGVRQRAHDPQVIIAGGDGSFPVGSVFAIFSPTGTSPVNLSGGSPCIVGTVEVLDCVFSNASGSRWTSLTFAISPSNQIGPFTCLVLAYFTQCSFNQQGTQVTFSGGIGIAANQDFLVEVVLWAPGSTFSATATLAKKAWLVLPPTDLPARSRPSTLVVFLSGHVAAREGEKLETGLAHGV